MRIVETTAATHVVGLELRTNNERAFEDIPAHWQRVHREGLMARLEHRSSDDLFAVYTRFEHPGVDNLGEYSLIIGAQVADPSVVPSGLTLALIPAARCAVFPVERGHPERVGERWRDIWANTDIVKTFVCDHELYQPNGEIDIFVGIR